MSGGKEVSDKTCERDDVDHMQGQKAARRAVDVHSLYYMSIEWKDRKERGKLKHFDTKGCPRIAIVAASKLTIR